MNNYYFNLNGHHFVYIERRKKSANKNRRNKSKGGNENEI